MHWKSQRKVIIMDIATVNEKKKGIGVLAVLLCVLAVVCTGTLAYFTAKDTVTNEIGRASCRERV